MSRILFLITIIFLLPYFVKASDEALFNDVKYKTYDTVTRSVIPKESIDGLIAKLKETPHAKHRSILIRLEDQDTIKNLTLEFIETKGQSLSAFQSISSSGAPWVLPNIADNLYVEESTDKLGLNYDEFSARPYYGISVHTAQLMRQLLQLSQDIPEGVREWAKQSRGTNNQDLRNSMRQWWNENQAAIETREYDKLTVPSGNPVANNQSRGAQPQPTSVKPEPPKPVQPQVEPAPFAVETPEPKPLSFPWLWIGTIVVISGVVAFFVIQRRRS
jgi:hypothetical protein